jgi:hypothetical protein
MKMPKEYIELVYILALRRSIIITCRKLGLPLRPDTKEDRATNRANWKKLRSFHPPEQAAKVSRLVDMVARKILAS